MTESTPPPAEPEAPEPEAPKPKPNPDQVLVVGAGPCGLALACELRQHGIAVRVLEAREDRVIGSRAVQLWPLGLEVLRTVGVLDEALRRGLRVHTNVYHLHDRVLTVDLGAGEPLMLPQQQTMELLEGALERLGGQVERGVKVTAVEAGEHGVTVKAKGPDGTAQQIQAGWLVGADGVHSIVREQLGIGFPGDRLPLDFLLAEGRIDGDCKPGELHYYLGPGGSAVVGPMPGGKVRVSGVLAPGFPLTTEAVQGFLDQRTNGDLTVEELETLGVFATAERIATGMRRGRVFLVGDAAHTHTPVGGQGLNLGLQDAHNLAWKLAGVVGGRYAPEILDTYEPERLQAARQIVGLTHWMIKMFTLGPIASRARNTSWNLLGAAGVLRRWFVPLLAGHKVRYPDALRLGPETGSGRRLPAALWLAGRGLPPAGARLPKWVSETAPNSARADAASDAAADATSNTANTAATPDTPPGFRLLTVGRDANSPLARRGRRLAQAYGTAVRHEHHRRRTAPGFLLLRPDGYVAMSGAETAGLDRLDRRLKSLITRQEPGPA